MRSARRRIGFVSLGTGSSVSWRACSRARPCPGMTASARRTGGSAPIATVDRPSRRRPHRCTSTSPTRTAWWCVSSAATARSVWMSSHAVARANGSTWPIAFSHHGRPSRCARLRRVSARAGSSSTGYIKARGMGLALPLGGFSFDLPPQRPDDVQIQFTGALDDTPARWQFGVGPLGDHHLVATAVAVDAGTTIRITTREAASPLL